MQSQRAHINGFDWLRAIMSVLIVTWHLHTFGKSQLFSDQIASYKLNAGDILNFQIVPISVPIFLLISCYLLARFPTDWAGLRQRLGRLSVLYIFWVFMMTLWKGGYEELQRVKPESAYDLLLKVLSGYGEFFYFFVTLILCLLATFVFMRLSSRWNLAALILATAAVFFLPQVSIALNKPMLVAYWNPLNFLPYPFLGIILHRHQDALLASGKRLALVCAVLLTLSAALAWYEWTHLINTLFIPGNDLAYPVLMRVSLVLSTTAVFLFALWPWRAAPPIIQFMSRHSLALFVLHAFFRPLIAQSLPVDFFPSAMAARLAGTAVVIAACYLFSLIAPVFFKEELIR